VTSRYKKHEEQEYGIHKVVKKDAGLGSDPSPAFHIQIAK
jgi:hypothetical protein